MLWDNIQLHWKKVATKGDPSNVVIRRKLSSEWKSLLLLLLLLLLCVSVVRFRAATNDYFHNQLI